MGKKTTEQFIEDAKKVHGDKYDYSKVIFEHTKTKVCIICPIHGEFWQTPNKHLLGRGCPGCKNEKSRARQKMSNDDFLKKAIAKHGDKYIYDKVVYIDSQTPVEIICPLHGSFIQRPVSHLRGCNCPKCAIQNRVNTHKIDRDEIITRCCTIHNNFYDYSNSKWTNLKDKVEINCPVHGSFMQTMSDHLSGKGCPKCSRKSQYKILSFLENAFPEEKWEWEYSPKWLGSQRFDIFCRRAMLAIEYNGIQHYQPIDCFGGEEAFNKGQHRDKRKVQLCKDNNCTLYIIRYDDVNYDRIREDINNILNSNKNETY